MWFSREGENSVRDALLDSRAFAYWGVGENTGEEVTLVRHTVTEESEGE